MSVSRTFAAVKTKSHLLEEIAIKEPVSSWVSINCAITRPDTYLFPQIGVVSSSFMLDTWPASLMVSIHGISKQRRKTFGRYTVNVTVSKIGRLDKTVESGVESKS